MGFVRVKPWERRCVVAHPDTGEFITPDPTALYRDDDPLVVAHGWLFAGEAELAQAADGGTGAAPESSQPVEQASAAPGERRPTRRAK